MDTINARVIATLTGAQKIKALLEEQGLTLKDFAREANEWVQDVSACIHNEREFPEIRNKLARRLRVKRAEIDTLIGQKAA